MAPLPTNLTDTYFVDYEGPMGQRSFQFRMPVGSADGDASTSAQAFIEHLQPVIYSSVQFIALRKRTAGSTVSFPITWFAMAGTASGTLQQQDYPRYLSFVGRSNDGRRVKLSVYGVTLSISNDYRLSQGENAAVLAATSWLNGPTCPWVTISGNDPVWQLYGNQGYNSYFQQEQRNNA